MSGTHLYYNGVLLQDCETKEFIQEIEMDESDTDVMYSRFRITVVSRIVSIDDPDLTYEVDEFKQTQHDAAVKVPAPGPGKYEAAESKFEAIDQLRIAQARLQEPRKDFWLAVNGTRKDNPAAPTPLNPSTSESPSTGYRIVLAATGDYDHHSDAISVEYPEFIRGMSDSESEQFTNAARIEHIDCNEGPKPRAVNVSIIGGRYLTAQFTIEVCLSICRGVPSGTVPPVRDARKVKGVISNKWSVTENLDTNFCTTHNIEGVLVVSDHRYKAMGMRTMVHPGLFPYAKLEGRQFAVDRTGKKLAYQFTIKEVGAAPPRGIVDWDGTYTESSAMGTANQFGTLTAKVRGTVKLPPGQTRQQQRLVMLRLLFTIVQSRLTGINAQWNPLPGNNATTTLLKEATVSENLKEPVMEIRVNVMHSGGALNDYNLRLENMGKPLPIATYDDRWWPLPDFFQFDTANENAEEDDVWWGGSYFEQYFQGPCNLWHSTPRGAKTDEIPLATEVEDPPEE